MHIHVPEMPHPAHTGGNSTRMAIVATDRIVWTTMGRFGGFPSSSGSGSTILGGIPYTDKSVETRQG